jgi:hypothetical protein
MGEAARTVPRGIWRASWPSSSCWGAGERAQYICVRGERQTRPQNRQGTWTRLSSLLLSTIPTGSQETCSVVKRLVVCRTQGVWGSPGTPGSWVTGGRGGGRGIGSPVPRNSANHAIAETARRGRAKGSGRRTSYHHESRPLTKVVWSTRSPEVAQSGFAKGVLTRVLLRCLPESVCMRPPPSLFRLWHCPWQGRISSFPRARSASPSQERSQQGHVISSGAASAGRVSKVLQPLPTASWIRRHVARK